MLRQLRIAERRVLDVKRKLDPADLVALRKRRRDRRIQIHRRQRRNGQVCPQHRILQQRVAHLHVEVHERPRVTHFRFGQGFLGGELRVRRGHHVEPRGCAEFEFALDVFERQGGRRQILFGNAPIFLRAERVEEQLGAVFSDFVERRFVVRVEVGACKVARHFGQFCVE